MDWEELRARVLAAHIPRRDSDVFEAGRSSRQTGLGGKIAAAILVTPETTQHTCAPEERLKRAIEQQAAVAELGLRALEEGALQPLLEAAVALVSRTLGVEFVKVDQLLPDEEGLLVTAGVGWSEGVVGSCVIPTGRGSPSGHALLLDEPVIVDDMSAERRFEVPAVLREHDVMSYISVVVAPRGGSFGTLSAASRHRRSFSKHDINFVQSAANVLATAVARLRTDQRVAVVRERERRRVARELHDDGLRELTEALGVATIGRSSATTTRDEQRWAAVAVSLRRLGQQLRGAIYDLRLGTQEDRGFADLLDELIEVQDELFGAGTVELHGRELLASGSLGHSGGEALRIVREAITNARRHSGAALVLVDISGSTPTELRIDVNDDGAWSDREAALSGHQRGMGLVGMRERAEDIGAELRIRGRRDGGTQVSLVLRLSRDTIQGS